METPSLPTREASPWKRIAIISFFSGFGVALAAALVLSSVIWHKSRPIPPKPWNTSALVVTGSPSLSVSKDGKTLELGYSVKNNTNVDYNLNDEAAKKLRLMEMSKDGELSPPFENRGFTLQYTPIFIPANQTGTLTVSIEDLDLPTPKNREVKADYDERLRNYLKSESMSEFLAYDEVNRYQINLPIELVQKQPRTNAPPSSSGSSVIPVPRGISGLQLGMTAEQIRDNFKITEAEDPLAVLLTKYGNTEAGKAVSSENQKLDKQFFNISADSGKTGTFPGGVTSADADATHDIVYQIGLHYDEASAKKLGWQGVAYPYVAKYGKPSEDTGSAYIWKDGRTRLEIQASGPIINVFFTDEGLESDVKKEERNGSFRH